MKKLKNIFKRRGSVLVLAVVMVVIMFLIGMGLLQLGLNARVFAIRNVSRISARTAADAGFELAKNRVIDNWNSDLANWPDNVITTQPPTSLGGGTYGDATYEYTLSGTDPDGILLTSIGRTKNGAVRTVYATLALKTIFTSIGARNNIDIGNGGVLGTIPAGDDFLILTASTESPPQGGVMLRNGVEVPGDVIIGYGGNADAAIIEKKDVIITGDSKAASEKIPFESNDPPTETLTTYTSVAEDSSDPNGNTLLINSSGQYSTIHVGAEGDLHTTLKIDGDVTVYVTGEMILGAGTELVITEGSSLDLYLGDSLDIKQGSSITYGDGVHVTDAEITEAAKSMSITGTATCDSIIIFNDGDFYGAIDAPDADVEIKNSGDFYGALMAGNSLIVKNGAGFIFVSALYDLQTDEDKIMGIKAGSWHEN